jgi:REP element-mobilizing transposase RayT
MGRPIRLDLPGDWHHVLNRGLGRRAVFETRADIRFFLAQIARAVRRGELEVHAYCVLTNHYHLLVRSPSGSVSRAMQRIQARFVRRFNTLRRRDGPLFRGRFGSRRIVSEAHWRAVVRYIDANAVEAGLVTTSGDYPWGSARCYAAGSGPRWLRRDVILAETGEPSTEREGDFGPGEAGSGHGLLDGLMGAGSAEITRWMLRQAHGADGLGRGDVLVPADHVQHAIERARTRDGEWLLRSGYRTFDAWEMLACGLLRSASCLTFQQIAEVVGCSVTAAHARWRRHGDLLRSDPAYRARATAVVSGALTPAADSRQERTRRAGSRRSGGLPSGMLRH